MTPPIRHPVRLTLAGLLALAVATAPAEAKAKKRRPLVITRGGTYSGGLYVSLDPDVPVVSIRTDEPVVLQHLTLRGSGDLIVSRYANADVTVQDCSGESIPPSEAGRSPGRFADIEGFVNVRIENCQLEGTSGIYLLDYAGDETKQQTVTIQRNVAHNIDGQVSDGNGGYQSEPALVQFVQLDKVRHVSGATIAWNRVINDPGESRVEDVISVYLSSGRRTSPIAIHDNFIRGAYPADPEDDAYSGGGIMLGDGVSEDGPSGDAYYVVAYDNQVLDTVNYGIAISAGHDLAFYDNRIVSAGVLKNGHRIRAQNVGAYVWDSYDAGPDRFWDNGGDGNVIGWTRPLYGRNDWWTPDADAWGDNAAMPDDLDRSAYDAETAAWDAKLADNGIELGPRQ